MTNAGTNNPLIVNGSVNHYTELYHTWWFYGNMDVLFLLFENIQQNEADMVSYDIVNLLMSFQMKYWREWKQEQLNYFT